MKTESPAKHEEPSAKHKEPHGIYAKFVLHRHGKIPFSMKVDIHLPTTGVTALFGPSGSGKTTLLRCIAGLEAATTAELRVNGEIWQNEQINKPTYKRPIGMVFQDANLFPHLSAQQNLHYAIKRADKPITPEFSNQVIDIMGIKDILDHKPHALSGGEQQRVAIARALLIHPSLLLMDEPLASLDGARKQEILPYLEKLKHHVDIPVIYVSHSMEEVARLADHAVLLSEGRVLAEGSLNDVFTRADLPQQFQHNASAILHGTVRALEREWQLARVDVSAGELWISHKNLRVDSALRLRIMASDVAISVEKLQGVSTLNQLPVTVDSISDNNDGATTIVSLRFGRDKLVAKITRRSVALLELTPEKKVWAQIKSVAILQ